MRTVFGVLAFITLVVVACGPTAVPTPTLQPTFTPAPTPNIEATVEARLQATLAAMPTPTPAPTPTPSPRLSQSEAQSALVNYLLKEIFEIRIEKEREEIATRVGDFLPTVTYEGDGKWVLFGQGRKLNSDGSSEWAEGRWELQETGRVVTPINSEAVTLLEFVSSWQRVSPTPTPRPTPTPFPRDVAEKILFRAISKCVRSAEKEYGAPRCQPSSNHSGQVLLYLQ